jgi:2-polyprenyl-3-methyl-5-hydroxy-6-metoxy-1,4-benzoquinol methylase
MNDKKHTYEYAVDTNSETAPANVVRLIGANKRVLEIGCGPGSITRILSEISNCKVIGLELDPEAIKKVKPYCVEVMQADLNSNDWPNLLDDMPKFDVVLAADVLEHLYDPWNALKRMVPLMNDNGCIVISLPHVGHAAVMSCLINGNFRYGDWGLLDRTHIRFFGLQNIEALFAQANLKIIDAKYVTKPPSETEFADSWAALAPTLQDALMTTAHAHVYQVVVKAVPLDRAEPSVALIAPAFHYGNSAMPIFNDSLPQHIGFKTFAGQFLTPELKAVIRKVLGLVGVKL